jgi:hypothetical protein
MGAGLRGSDALRLVGTRPTMVPARGGGWSALFPVSANVNGPTSGIAWVLTNLFFTSEATAEERLTEAVGVAALQAVGSNRPRALVLVRSSRSRDEEPPGALQPGNVLAFLRELRVPFFYWLVGAARDRVVDAWGEPRTIRGWGGVNTAVEELVDGLRPQFLVWIEGLYQPGEIELAASAPAALRLAGAAPSAQRLR